MFSEVISALLYWNFLFEESTNFARLALKPVEETAFEICVTLIHADDIQHSKSSLQTQAIRTSTCTDKICLVRALYSGCSLLSGYTAVLFTALVSMARVCNSWKQNCNLSVCTDSLWVLVYLLTYFCLWDTAARVSWGVLLWSAAVTVPSHKTCTASAASETISPCKSRNLNSKEVCTQQARLEQKTLARQLRKT